MKLFGRIIKLLGSILACLERIDKKMPILDDVNALEQAEVALETGVNKLLADKQDAEKRASDAEAKAVDLQTQLDAANQAKTDAEAKATDLQAKAAADAANNTQAEQQIQALNDKLTALENLVSPPAPAPPADNSGNAPAPTDTGVTAPVPDVPAPVQGTDIPVLQPVPASDGLQQSINAAQGGA